MCIHFNVAGPSFPSTEGSQVDKLPDVLSSTGRKAKSCLVDREFAISKHATGQQLARGMPSVQFASRRGRPCHMGLGFS